MSSFNQKRKASENSIKTHHEIPQEGEEEKAHLQPNPMKKQKLSGSKDQKTAQNKGHEVCTTNFLYYYLLINNYLLLLIIY
jgi:hypothetical protein